MAVLQCLKKASESHGSISFPAIGTGNPGVRKRDVASAMLKAVTEFVAEEPHKRLGVYFVVHSYEEDTFKVK